MYLTYTTRHIVNYSSSITIMKFMHRYFKILISILKLVIKNGLSMDYPWTCIRHGPEMWVSVIPFFFHSKDFALRLSALFIL